MKQVIDISNGAVLYTLPWTLTDTTGKDLTEAVVKLSLGSMDAPGAWRDPDVVEHPAPSQIRAKLLVGDTLRPDPGSYYLWRKLDDFPEIEPVRTTLAVEIV